MPLRKTKEGQRKGTSVYRMKNEVLTSVGNKPDTLWYRFLTDLPQKLKLTTSILYFAFTRIFQVAFVAEGVQYRVLEHHE